MFNFIKNLFYKLIKRLPFYRHSLGCGGNIEIGRKVITKHLKRIDEELKTMIYNYFLLLKYFSSLIIISIIQAKFCIFT